MKIRGRKERKEGNEAVTNEDGESGRVVGGHKQCKNKTKESFG